MPWATKFTGRSVFYHSFDSSSSGLEYTSQLSRKLSEKFSLVLQHQYQRNLPDLRLQNYRRLRLLLGYDF